MWYIIIALLTIIYFFTKLFLPNLIGGEIGSYILKPLIYILLAITTYFIAKQEGLNIIKFKKIRRWEFTGSPFQAALLIGGFQVSLLIIAGILVGFGKSPYSFTPTNLIFNIIFVLSTLLGLELSRAYLIKKGSITRRNMTIIIGTVALLFMLISINPSEFQVLNFSDPPAAVKFIGEEIIPILAMGLFASYLAYLGGALSAMGYVGLIQAFQWFSPYLPDLDWSITALIGTIVPALGFLVIQNSIQITQRIPGGKRKKQKKIEPTLSWTGVAVICVVLVFFSTGFFGVQPTVIYSGSMRSTLDVGDIVIILQTHPDEINTGDIIQYKAQNAKLPVVHRVYDKYTDKRGNILFITKGDANDNPDSEPVLSQNVVGKTIFNIPKIGWLPIFFRDMLHKIGLPT
jgi:signal peptidase